ncbi:MAG: MFS transporter [Deltaproteobacteria bacterium]|nr:MFS transporter [Deltaproteobacteria bacterium]
MERDNRKSIISWALYDWANSAFATTVMAAFFPIFFKKFWSAGVDPVESTAKLGLANSIAGMLVALCAPVLGAIADRGGAKKKFLLFFAFMGVVMTASLYLVSQGDWVLAIAVYVLATVGFSGGNIFYDSLLPAVASDKRMDFVSALGFSLGYLGGGLLFALNVTMTLKPALFGFADAGTAVRFSFLSVAAWWALFSIPVFLFVREPAGEKTVAAGAAVAGGLRQLRRTFEEIRHLRVIFLFLIAYWLYIDGVDTIIRMALDYGMSIGFDSNDLILALLITQFVGFPSAIAFGYLGGKIGTKRSIYIAIAVYLCVTIYASFITRASEFYVLAIVIGLVQGGIQALSRSLYARMIPVDKAGEFFGFYNLIGKFSVVAGPIFIGVTALLVRSMGYSSDIASRVSITSIAVLFVAGAVLLFFVDEKAGKKEARYL